MSVWFAIPSARPPEERDPRLQLWRERGYKLAISVVKGTPAPDADLLITYPKYPGWARAVNSLANILVRDYDAQWIVTGGDDYEPDLSHAAEEIAEECSEHFGGTWGVMQPTGDRWGASEPWAQQMYPDAPAYLDRICGSPWLGREFCQRINEGHGPLWPEYAHMFADEELQCVAQRYGILWQRRDLIQLHQHWARRPEGASAEDCPEFLRWTTTPQHWDESKALFSARKADDFPGHEPICRCGATHPGFPAIV
jgi:hypothetical protein